VEGHHGAQNSSVNLLSTAEVSCAITVDYWLEALDPGQQINEIKGVKQLRGCIGKKCASVSDLNFDQSMRGLLVADRNRWATEKTRWLSKWMLWIDRKTIFPKSVFYPNKFTERWSFPDAQAPSLLRGGRVHKTSTFWEQPM